MASSTLSPLTAGQSLSLSCETSGGERHLKLAFPQTVSSTIPVRLLILFFLYIYIDPLSLILTPLWAVRSRPSSWSIVYHYIWVIHLRTLITHGFPISVANAPAVVYIHSTLPYILSLTTVKVMNIRVFFCVRDGHSPIPLTKSVYTPIYICTHNVNRK